MVATPRNLDGRENSSLPGHALRDTRTMVDWEFAILLVPARMDPLRMHRPRPRRPISKRLLARLFVACILPTSFACSSGPRDEVLVLARRDDATSVAIARYYADRLDLSDDRVLELTLTIPSGAETIDALTYRAEIAEAIERHLVRTETTNAIRRLVTTRGLPLEIEDCREESAGCSRASLDAALAQLGRTRGEKVFERVPNPYFRATRPFSRLRDDDDGSALRFLVTRLTASYTDAEASDAAPGRLVEALEREARPEDAGAPIWHVAGGRPKDTAPPATRLLLDPIATRLSPFGYRVCEDCEATTATGLVLARGGEVDPLPRLEGPGLILSLVAHPVGRRTGNAPSFGRFVDRWLSRGATGLSLHLDDPFLADVARPDVQLEAWARGLTAAEAHYASLPLLGGSHVFVGDGLRSLAPVPLPEALEGDRDGDGVADSQDNCPADANPNQRDTNGDGFGNLCDADVDDDGDVDTSLGRIYPFDARGDLESVTLTARNGPYDPDHDLDGDGRVDEHDLLRVQLALSRPPGR